MVARARPQTEQYWKMITRIESKVNVFNLFCVLVQFSELFQNLFRPGPILLNAASHFFGGTVCVCVCVCVCVRACVRACVRDCPVRRGIRLSQTPESPLPHSHPFLRLREHYLKRHFGASKIALTQAGVLKHDLSVRNSTVRS